MTCVALHNHGRRTRRTFSIVMLFVLVALAALNGCEADEPRHGRPASDDELAALLASFAQRGFQGAVIAEQHGERRIEAGYGQLSATSTRAPDAQTAFDCGSIMKEVTAAVIFLLEDDGALSRTDRLDQHFADVPEQWRAVTIDQVLTHRAGFDEYHDVDGDFEAMDRATALARIFAQHPRFEPGSDEAYSNSGYTLLAALIEQVTGDDYRSVVKARVFAPLALTRSGFYGDALWTDGNVAIGRGAEQHDGNDPSRWPEPTWALIGNGGLVSTVEDLLSLAKGFDDDRLFAANTREAFRGAQPSGRIDGKQLLGYAGGNDYGFNAVVALVAEDSSYVVAASHVFAPVTAEALAIEMTQALYGAEIELPEDD